MILKQILLMISSVFFNLKRKTSNTQENVTEMIRKSISAEISQMSFKILVGFILVSVIVFSMVQFGRAMQFFLSQLENGYVYEIIAFGTIAVISCILLYSLFHTQRAEETFEVETSLVNTTPKSLVSEFAKGFMRGLGSKPTNAIERNKNIY